MERHKMLPSMKPVGPVRSLMIKLSGRSWWEAQYLSGKVVAEWDTLQGEIFNPLGNQATSRWEEIPKAGLVAIRLLCPNGQAGELRTTGSYSIFQLKSGRVSVTVSPQNFSGNRSQNLHCLYHIIGAIVDTNGKCMCYAWDYEAKTLLKFEDNVTNMAFDNIGQLNLGEAVGIK